MKKKLIRTLYLLVVVTMIFGVFACSKSASGDVARSGTEMTTDVVVIGAGGTGLAAAASAHEQGAAVIVLEKLPFAGGSTALSGGGISATGTRFQVAEGIEDTKQSWMDLWVERQAVGNPDGMYPDYDRVDEFMDEAVVTTEWLVDYIGHEYGFIAGFGLDPVRRLHFSKTDGTVGGGAALTANIDRFLRDEGVQILTETPARELITDDDGNVVGVVAENSDGEMVIHAKKVILATGGYAQSEDLLERFIPEVAGSTELSAAAVGTTGDGIVMAEAVGAALYEEPWDIGLGTASKIDNTDSIMMDWSKVYVNSKGERFTNEQVHYAIATNEIIDAEEPWLIFDSSEANSELVAAVEAALPTEEAVKGGSFEELARMMGVPVGAFVGTMATFNAGVKSGNDGMGKDPEFLVAVDTAPYYALKIYPKTMGTFAGVKTDELFRVVREDGSVINNLYAGGEMANKVLYNRVYMSGSAVQFALTSGRLAGKHAALNLE